MAGDGDGTTSGDDDGGRADGAVTTTEGDGGDSASMTMDTDEPKPAGSDRQTPGHEGEFKDTVIDDGTTTTTRRDDDGASGGAREGEELNTENRVGDRRDSDGHSTPAPGGAQAAASMLPVGDVRQRLGQQMTSDGGSAKGRRRRSPSNMRYGSSHDGRKAARRDAGDDG